MSDYSFQIEQVQQEINITLAKIQEMVDAQPTLRDRFAMAALTGFSANSDWSWSWEDSAPAAYEIADEMMEARKQ